MSFFSNQVKSWRKHARQLYNNNSNNNNYYYERKYVGMQMTRLEWWMEIDQLVYSQMIGDVLAAFVSVDVQFAPCIVDKNKFSDYIVQNFNG